MHFSNGTVDECVECQHLANVSWDVWRDMNISMMKSNNANIHIELVLALMRKVVQSMENGVDVLDDQYSHWNRPLIDACLIFLVGQSDIDLRFGYPDDGHATSKLDVYESDRRWNGTRMLDFFYSRCMKAICNETDLCLTVLSSGVDYICHQLMTQDDMPIIMTPDYIWIPMPCNSIEECDAMIYLAYVRDDPSSMWVAPPLYFMAKLELYTDASSQYRTELDYPLHLSSNLYSERAGVTAPHMTVIYSMAMMTVENRDGIKDNNHNLCLHKCSKLWIMRQYGCIPFTYRKGINWPDPSLPCYAMLFILDPNSYQST